MHCAFVHPRVTASKRRPDARRRQGERKLDRFLLLPCSTPLARVAWESNSAQRLNAALPGDRRSGLADW